MRSGIVAGLAGVAGLALAAAAAAGLASANRGLEAREASVDGVPVRMTSPPGEGHPAVVLAHGFSGSAELMGSMATALASSGLAVVTFDFPGHGESADALPGGGGMSAEGSEALRRSLDSVVAWALEQPEVDPSRLALAGHSMGAGAVVRYGSQDALGRGVARAVVALSLPSAEGIPAGEAAVPRNLLLLAGSLEPARFRDAALDGLHAAYPGAPLGAVQGDPAAGTARMAAIVDGVEHIGIVLAPQADRLAVAWLAEALDAPLREPVEPRTALWLVVTLAAAVLLIAAAGAFLLPGRSTGPPAIGAWPALAIALAAAVAASLASAALGGITDAVPIAIAGYLGGWFAVAGAAALALLRWRGAAVVPAIGARDAAVAVGLAAAATLAIALPGRLLWAPFAVTGARGWVLAALVLAFTAWAWADELLVRRAGTGRRLLVALGTRAVLVVVLLAGIPLLGAPGFLILLLPLMALLLAVLAAMAAALGRRPGGFLAAVLVQAVPLAALVATTFPTLG